MCDPANGLCDYAPVEDGTSCGDGAGTCQAGSCAGTFACTEQGIRDAIAVGGGPHTFDCEGPTTVVTEADIEIDNDVILDGEGNLTVDGDEDHRVFSVAEGITAELRGLTVTKGFGDGIWNHGTLTLTHSTVSGNSGGIWNLGTGTLTLTNSTVSGNGRGGIWNLGTGTTLTNSTVSGNTGGGDYGGGGILNFAGTLTLTHSTVSGNSHYLWGGGIWNHGTLTLTNSTVSGNTAGDRGGGIWNDGTLTLTDSTVSGNTAAQGGGIFAGGRGTLTNSTVSGNSAQSGGGGIYNDSRLTLISSTVSGNSAQSGGGIYEHGTLTLISSTVSGNSAQSGGGILNFAGTLTLTDALVDNDCVLPASIVSGGGNLESPGDTCGLDQSSDQVNVTAEQLKLGPLQDNGGPTMTHALGAGSVAIDQIPEADCVDADGQPLTTDQRGEPRPETGGTMCDVGAFEVQP
jgi:predicted outer membrane repeat protein